MATKDETPRLKTASQIDDALKGLKTQPVEYKGVKGMFVDLKKLDKIEDDIVALLSDPGDESPTKIMELSAEIEALRKQKLVAEEASKRANAELYRVKKDITEYRASVEAIQSQNAEAEKEWEKVITDLRAELKVAKDANLEHKKTINSLRRSSDPDAMESAVDSQKKTAKQITDINNRLQEANAQRKALRDEVTKAKANLQAMQAQLDEEKAQVALLKSAKSGQDPVKPASVQIDTPILRQLIGDKGVKWLIEAERTTRENVRERALDLLKATSSGHTEIFRGLNGLLKIIYGWCKTKSYQARKRVQPWVDMVFNDIATVKFKSLKFYREQLERLIDVKEKASEKVNHFILEARKHRDDAWPKFVGWCMVLERRAKRGFKWLRAKLDPTPLWNKLRNWWSGLHDPGTVTEQDVEDVLFNNPGETDPLLKGKGRA